MKTLSVVIINYRTAELTIDALRSLCPDMENRNDRCAVVVDNCSADGSPELIQIAIDENGWQPWARIELSPVNGGFSAGNNLGMATQQAEFYLLLNSDARVLPGTIECLLTEMHRDSEIGLIGPRLQWENGDPQVSCFRNRTPLSEFLSASGTGFIDRLFKHSVIAVGLPETRSLADWVSFACVMIRGDAFRHVGKMDEGYFLYFEDIDYCRRAYQAGWKVAYQPEAGATHLRGGTASLKQDAAARRRLPRYIYESRSRYFAKFNGGIFGVLSANVMWMLGRLISFLRETLGGKTPHTSDRQLLDNWINWSRPMRNSSYMPWAAKK